MDIGKFSLMTFSLAGDIAQRKMTLRESLQMAADGNIPYVDVMRVKEKDILTYQNAMNATGVKVYCYIAYISFFANAESIRKSLRKNLSIARELGAKLLMIVPYIPFFGERIAQRHDRMWVLTRMTNGFHIAVQMSEIYGLTVCFETTPQEVIRLSGIEDCKYVLDQVPGLKLAFDTANMLPHGDKTLEAYEALKEYIVHVHLKDVALSEFKPSIFPQEVTVKGELMNNTVFGEGVIPIDEVYLKMLKDGYDGVFAIEYAHPNGKACNLRENEAQLKKHIDYLRKVTIHD